MGRGGLRPMRCGLCMDRSARPMRRPMYFLTGRTAAHEMWCTTATTTTTSTVPIKSPTCFDGLTRAVVHEMWCTTAKTTFLDDFFGCGCIVIRQNCCVRTTKSWQITSGAEYNMTPCENKCWIKALVPLWVYRRHSLPSR